MRSSTTINSLVQEAQKLLNDHKLTDNVFGGNGDEVVELYYEYSAHLQIVQDCD